MNSWTVFNNCIYFWCLFRIVVGSVHGSHDKPGNIVLKVPISLREGRNSISLLCVMVGSPVHWLLLILCAHKQQKLTSGHLVVILFNIKWLKPCLILSYPQLILFRFAVYMNKAEKQHKKKKNYLGYEHMEQLAQQRKQILPAILLISKLIPNNPKGKKRGAGRKTKDTIWVFKMYKQ